MSFKKIIVLMMTLVMLMSAFAPTLNVLAANVQDKGASQTTKTKIDYVSLGDSIANGLGLDGYGPKEVDLGLPSRTPGSYPVQFAAWLAGAKDFNDDKTEPKYVFNGNKGQVSLAQLAMTSMRIEDVIYLLTHDSEFLSEMTDEELEKEIAENPWLYEMIVGEDAPISKQFWSAFLAGTYQQMIKDAEIVSLGFGNDTFTTFFYMVLMDYLFGGDTYDYMTLENAMELLDNLDKSKYEAAVTELYNEYYAKFEDEVNSSESLKALCELMAEMTVRGSEELTDKLDDILCPHRQAHVPNTLRDCWVL